MAYPLGTPSDNFTSGIFTSDFSPSVVVGAIIDNHTPVNNLGMKNSVGYQIALVQNYVNTTYLGRYDKKVNTAYINYVGTDTYHCTGVYSDLLKVEEYDNGYELSHDGYYGVYWPEYNLSLRSSGIVIRADRGGASVDGALALIGEGDVTITGNGASSEIDLTSPLIDINASTQLDIDSLGDINIGGSKINLKGTKIESTNLTMSGTNVTLQAEGAMNIRTVGGAGVETVTIAAKDALEMSSESYVTITNEASASQSLTIDSQNDSHIVLKNGSILQEARFIRGNLFLGDSTTGTSTGDHMIGLQRTGSDPTVKYDRCYLYASGVTSTTHMYVMDGAGNQTQISPHNEDGKWIYKSNNVLTGKKVTIDMEEFVKFIDAQFGTHFYREE